MLFRPLEEKEPITKQFNMIAAKKNVDTTHKTSARKSKQKRYKLEHQAQGTESSIKFTEEA